MVTAFIQARMSSTRLPGKVLLPLAGSTVLERVVERVQAATQVEKTVVLTSQETSDTPIAEACQRAGIACFRGSLNDVLDRFYRAAQQFNVRDILRVTADCPLIDAQLIDQLILQFQTGGYQYCAVNRPLGQETYPDGFDAEVFSRAVLEQVSRETSNSYDREHVTPYIWTQPHRFRCFFQRAEINRAHLRLTLDTPADYALIKEIYAQVQPLTASNVIAFAEANQRSGRAL